MTYAQAIEAINNGQVVELVVQDATRSVYLYRTVWLEDGELRTPHPTDPNCGDIAAPEDGRYVIGQPVTASPGW